MRVVRALAAANKFILEKPAEALEILKKRFDKMDQAVLAEAWKTVAAGARQGPAGHGAGARPFAEGEPGGEAAQAAKTR